MNATAWTDRIVKLVGGAAAAGVLVLAAACGTTVEVADLVLTNGKIVTMDAATPEAEAVAMAGDRIIAVGTAEEIERFVRGSTEVIDLEGRLAVPGFIEGHGHYMSLGQSKQILDLTTATTWDDIVRTVADAAAQAEPGAWITGRGWHQEKWETTPEPSVDGVPLHNELSGVSPDNPVLLTHASGHAAFANARAMELAGIDANTPNPDGGTIVRDAAGQPTGLLRETAQRLVSRVQAEADAERSAEEREADFRERVRLAGQEALSKGVTSFHDAGAGFSTIDRFRELADGGELPVRLYVMVRGESNDAMAERLPDYFMDGYADGFLTVRSIKRQIDGALGAHGAWLLEPYADHDSEGLVLESVESITRTAEIAAEHGFQVNTHAIGDRANREVLDIYEGVFGEAGLDGADLRWRIEHAQHIHPADIPRFGELGVIASMQAIHCTSDAPWVFERLGEERARTGAYVWRDLIDSGAVVTNGTDVPVEDINPIQSFYASVARVTADGEAFFPGQAMTREEALASYTIHNAFAAFEEDVKGSITPGKLADITVLSRDIMTIPAAEIPSTEVVYTILGGEIRYQAQPDAVAVRD